MQRQRMLDELAGRILSVKRDHPSRVGVDGVDAAGKTVLADELARVLQMRGVTVIRASIDGFHRPRVERQARGKFSPEGYYLDSFNYDALIRSLLAPLGPGGSRRYQTSVFDFIHDSAVEAEEHLAAAGDILLMEGVFLFRPELEQYWDFKIFVDVSFETNLARALKRDGYLFGEEDEILQRYMRRYIPGQKMYLNAVQPMRKADVVIDNNDFANPYFK